MTETGWDNEVERSTIDWRMSAALENVPRGDSDVPEVTNLAAAVREWSTLDARHQGNAVLTPERPLVLDGSSHEMLTGDMIAALAERLPSE